MLVLFRLEAQPVPARLLRLPGLPGEGPALRARLLPLELEGLLGPEGELSDIQQAFMDEAAIQCGFCTPGFIMTAVEILESGREYTDQELRKLLSGHLCRCTGYENILRAVKKTMLRRLGKA